MKTAIMFLAAFSSIIQICCAGEKRPAPEVAMAGPKEFVQSFPMVVSLAFKGGYAIPEDLAEGYEGGIGISFRLVSGGRQLSVGWEALGKPEEDMPRVRPRPEQVRSSQALTLTFDICQVAAVIMSDESTSLLPSAGEWEMKVVMQYSGRAESLPRTVKVRPPNELEKRVADQLAVKGASKSWFPTVALSDDPVPDASKLPAETRQIVKLIGILRSAVKSPEGGIKAIDDATEEWGYLDPLITFIRYECLLKLDRKDDAEKLRSRDPQFARDLQFNLIDEGKGLIARLQALKAKQQAEKKQSAGP